MPRTPKRLAGPLLVTNSVTTRYTVPASTKTVIRHLHVQNNSGSAATLTVSIGADAAGTRILDAFSIPAAAAGVTGSVVDFYGYWVMETTEILQTNAGTTNVLNLTVNGDEFTLG